MEDYELKPRKRIPFIKENYAELPIGTIGIVEADMCSNKTGAGNVFGDTDWDTLWIASSNELLVQTHLRMPEIFPNIHLLSLDDRKHTKNKKETREEEGNSLRNYSSLKKLSDYGKYDRVFGCMVIDEPLQLWNMSTGFKPDFANEQEFKARVKHTDRVWFLGKNFPEHLLDEIKNFGKPVIHYKYTDQNKMEGVLMTILESYRQGSEEKYKGRTVSKSEQLDTFIKEQLKTRLEWKEIYKNIVFEIESFQDIDPFITLPDGTLSPNPDYKEYEVSKDGSTVTFFNKEGIQKWENDKAKRRGIYIATEYSDGVEAIKAKWQNQAEKMGYKEANIQAIWSENASFYVDTLEELAKPNTETDIDMIVVSPSWAMGIHIDNKFTLVAWEALRGGKLLSIDEMEQALGRARGARHMVIADNDRNYKADTENSFIKEEISAKEISKKFNVLGIKNKGFLVRNHNTNKYEPMDGDLCRRAINNVIYKNKAKEGRKYELGLRHEARGGTIKTPEEWNLNWDYRISAPTAMERKQKILKAIPYTEDEAKDPIHFSDDSKRHSFQIHDLVGKPLGEPLDNKDWDCWDKGNCEDNFKRRKDLETKSYKQPSLSSLGQGEKEITELIDRLLIEVGIKERWKREMIITNEQLKGTKIYSEIKENQYRLNTLLRDELGWRYEDNGMQRHIKLDWQTDLGRLRFIAKILRKYSLHTEVIKPERVPDEYKDRPDLYAQATAENQPEFRKWKETKGNDFLKEHPNYHAKNKKLEHYLWNGLNERTLKFEELGKATQDYIKYFPHIKITHYWEINSDYV